MYIRRKVFSIAEDMYGDERYFSTTDIDLGFSDYDDNFYDERLYAEDEGLSTGAKVGLGVAGTAATTAGALYAAKKGWLGNRAKGWYESGASKLKNMFSKEAKKSATKRELTKEQQLARDYAKANERDIRNNNLVDGKAVGKFNKRLEGDIKSLQEEATRIATEKGPGSPEYKAVNEKIRELQGFQSTQSEIRAKKIQRAKNKLNTEILQGAERADAQKKYAAYVKQVGKDKAIDSNQWAMTNLGKRFFSDMYEDDYWF